MKIIRDSLYDIFEAVTSAIIEIEGRSDADLSIAGRKAWKLIEDCAHQDKLSPEASTAFWTAFGNCKVGRKEIANLINKERKGSSSKKVTANNIRDLLHDAREQIKHGLETELTKKKLKVRL